MGFFVVVVPVPNHQREREWLSIGTGSPGKSSEHQPARVRELFGRHFQAYGVILVSGTGPGVGLRGSLCVSSNSGYAIVLELSKGTLNLNKCNCTVQAAFTLKMVSFSYTSISHQISDHI